MDELLDTYHDELQGYDRIDNLDNFIRLELKGSIRYINKYDKKLKFGGLLAKIYRKDDNTWHCVLIKPTGKKYYVSFNNNYIFYSKSREEKMNDWANIFVSNIDKGLYEIVD